MFATLQMLAGRWRMLAGVGVRWLDYAVQPSVPTRCSRTVLMRLGTDWVRHCRGSARGRRRPADHSEAVIDPAWRRGKNPARPVPGSSARGALRPCRSGTKRRAPAPPFYFAEAVRPVLRSQALPALVSNATEPSGAFGEGTGSTVVARLRLAITRSVRSAHLAGRA